MRKDARILEADAELRRERQAEGTRLDKLMFQTMTENTGPPWAKTDRAFELHHAQWMPATQE